MSAYKYVRRIGQDFGRAACSYDRYAELQRYAASRLLAIYTPQENRVLDIGCGTGCIARLLQNRELIQVDVAPDMCKVARDVAPTTLCADMHALPLKGEAVAAITSSLAMQWAEDVEKVLAECFRVAQKGAVFACATLLTGTLGELSAAYRAMGQEVPVHDFLSKEALEVAFRSTGWREVVIETETKTMHYKDIKALLETLKHLGARYKHKPGGRYRGKGFFAQLEQHYPGQEQGNGISARWELAYITARKA